MIAGSSMALVQGDTLSAFGGTLAAMSEGVPVGHVEAGLRTHDPSAPWPEEHFRIAIDRLAALLFAPTELSAANLRREGASGIIHVTGNSGVDACLAAAIPVPRNQGDGRPRLLVTCHRRESWGPAMRSIAAALHAIAQRGLAEIELVLHPNPRVRRTMMRLLGGSNRIRLSTPCDHHAMLAKMQASDLILSDSGGMQEEAPVLGVPLLVLRDRTERPEAIVTGNMVMVGTDERQILRSVERLLRNPERLASMRRPARPHGDGMTAGRIADIIARWLEDRKSVEAGCADHPDELRRSA